MKIVRIDDWKKGASAVAAVKIVHDSTSLGLAKSKKSIEDALEGKRVDLTPRCGINSDELAAKLSEIGFSTTIVDD